MYKGLGVKRPRNRSFWKNFSDHGSVVSSGRIGGGITSEVTMDEDEEPWCPVVVADAGNREDVPITMLSAVTLPV